ncbi:MAG: LPS export ABC transporter permease LptG [Pseudomonadota bacterium]
MTLYLYFGRRFLSAFARVFLVLTILIYVLEVLENIRGLARHGVSFGESAYLAAFSTPELVLQALPVIVMLAGLTFCVGLARSNEFVVSRAIGVPALRAMAAPAFYAVGIGLVAMLALNPVAATFSARHDVLRDDLTGSQSRTISFEAGGFWLRQKNDDGHTVIHAESATDRGTALRRVTALDFDGTGDILRRTVASTAILGDGEWVFANGKSWAIDRASTNPESSAEAFELRRFPTDITPSQILEGYPRPASVPIWDKPRMIRTIAEAGFSNLTHRLHMQMELARPMMLVAMMIIGAAFTLQNARLGNLGVSVFLALICGFSLYFLQNLAMTLGEAGEIPVAVAAWAPPLAATLLALGLFLRFEDG